MKKAESKVYKERLLTMRARLRGDVTQMADAALKKTRLDSPEASSMPIHMADLGSDNFEQEFTLSLMENEEEVLSRIEAALERIEDTTYGICDECGCKIPKARLNAIPYAPTCVRCAELLERG
ncbi:MAG TPA: TraR/DksA C4-type zinc finger protein [Pirellulales bacterium]|jgi:DnaK suppressor protein|nr:TraR/DksA C4-type zinc finger protein [Pirellulales bacterium]